MINTGNAPATIGNIVVNLQKRQGSKWVTKSSDIADATNGDAATSAKIHKAASSEGKTTFYENGASGELNFMDATNNTLFSLVPQQMIGAGETKMLLFSASFDNNHPALQLQPGTLVRAEMIVSFGNATQSGNSTANVDINGNGTIEQDEARVRSVPSRLTLTVPAQTNGTTPILSDTLDDIVATGDVTFYNVDIDLDETSGTVTASVSGGTNGGTITNCAHLTSPDQTVSSGGSTFTTVQGIDLQACSTVDVGGTPPACTVPGAPGCPWEAGDAVTRTQSAWDATTSWYSTYDAIYAPSGIVEVGIPGESGFSMRFTNSGAISNYFVQSGTIGALNADLIDTTTSSSGAFGGQVLALRMNGHMSDDVEHF